MAHAAKKPSLLIALGGPKKPSMGEPDGDEGAMPGGDELGMDDVKQQAVDDVFDAVKSGDKALFADALERCVRACMGE